ncbi:hypothetical protein HBN54_001586 [Hymenobacter sp. 1B]|uniref:Ig-like domain-containing protein n=2 Tax=Hymenobacter artigasi TaxID=2719616 RepID=A0ABX1HFG6_9BACT|nr:hypothetical protein [Hymenobacter artigasi]
MTTSTLFRLRADAKNYPTGNCSKIDYVYVTLAPALSLSSSGVSGICMGTSTTLTASGSTGGYTWSANGTNIPNQTGATLTVAPTVTTTYTVTANTSCGLSSQQLTVPVFGVSVTPSAPVICAGESTPLTASYSGTSATYQWFVKGQPGVLSTSNTLTVAPNTTTTYQVVATPSDCGGTTITKDVPVTVGPPTVVISSGGGTICSGTSTTLTAVSNNPNVSFAWQANGAPIAGQTSRTLTVSPTATTTYTVTATAPCNTASSQTTVNVATAATFAVTPTTMAICNGSSATFIASSNITAVSYKWYKSTDLGTAIATTPSLTVSPTTNATYRVLTATSCGNNSQDVTVTVNTNPVSVSPPSTTINYGEATTLTASGGTSYTWTATSNNNTTTLPNTSASITVSPAYTTVYTATATNVASGCNTAQSTVGVNRPLPVELISFEAAWISNAPQLSWSTALEKNSAYFAIERSLDGVAFETVGQVEAAGNIQRRTEYSFRDARLPLTAAGTVYYRLRQVDVSGETMYSPIRTVRVAKSRADFQAAVYPNPYGNSVAVQVLSLSTEAVTMTVRNALGQVVLTHTEAAGSQEIVLPHAQALPVGLYYLTVQQGDRQQVLRLSHQ